MNEHHLRAGHGEREGVKKKKKVLGVIITHNSGRSRKDACVEPCQ